MASECMWLVANIRVLRLWTLPEDEESEEEGSGEEGVLAQFVSGEEDVPLIDATYRLAVVDLEWDRMRAVDVFAVRFPVGTKTGCPCKLTRSRFRSSAHSFPPEVE